MMLLGKILFIITYYCFHLVICIPRMMNESIILNFMVKITKARCWGIIVLFILTSITSRVCSLECMAKAIFTNMYHFRDLSPTSEVLEGKVRHFEHQSFDVSWNNWESCVATRNFIILYMALSVGFETLDLQMAQKLHKRPGVNFEVSHYFRQKFSFPPTIYMCAQIINIIPNTNI